jgi:pimeloyl-ACP methyl ester carboxylesterase
MATIDLATVIGARRRRLTPRQLVRMGFWLYGTLLPGHASHTLESIFLKPIVNTKLEAGPRFAAEEATEVAHNGQALRVWSWGDGPVVLFVHGWGGWAAQYDAFVAPLVAAGYRVVAFDGPAHGASGGERTDFFDFGEAARRVAETVGPLYAVVAHSFGAPVTTWVLKNGLDAKRVVLVAPPVDVSRFARFAGRYMGFPGKVSDRMQRRLEARFGIPWAELSTDAVVAELDIPLLVFHDVEDRQVRWQSGEAVAAAAKRGTYVRTEGLGHTRILGDADVVGRTLAFLEQR